jgi:hypothetical protein
MAYTMYASGRVVGCGSGRSGWSWLPILGDLPPMPKLFFLAKSGNEFLDYHMAERQ